MKEGIKGMEVGSFKQTSELPWLTVTTGVPLAFPLESPKRITTSVPAGIITVSRVYEVPLMSVKVARTGPRHRRYRRGKTEEDVRNPCSRTRSDILTRLNGSEISP